MLKEKIRLIVLCVGIAWIGAQAATLIPVEFEAMANRAELVVIGRVTTQEARFNEAETMILTHTTIEVEETIVGDAPGSIEIAEYGGRVGQRVMLSAAQVTYETGERVVVFACRDALDLMRTCGAHQGRLRVAPTADGTLKASGEMAGRPVNESIAGLKARVLAARGVSR